jgi:phospholipase C
MLVSGLLLSFLFAGCGGTSSGTAPTNPVPTVGITASPASLMAGSSSTLTVTAGNATQVTLSGSDGSSYTLAATGGTQKVNPGATTTYTAAATGAGGNISANATVSVTPNPAPTVTIAAAPASLMAGSSSTLTVAATNATQVTVAGTDGSTYTLEATGGTQIVSPSATTTYTATASGAGGKTTATATVTVSPDPAPTVSIAAASSSIIVGSSTTLTVTAANATQVIVTGSDGSTHTLQASGGTQLVSPGATTTYSATATGAGGSTTATAMVTVNPPAPAVSISANPTSIVSGSSSTLTVAATNATQVTVTGTDGSSYTLPGAGGTQSVSPSATTTYTATATGTGGSTTATAKLTVTPYPAPTVSIAANPITVVAGSSSKLTVAATNATQVTVTGTDGSSYTLSAAGGTQSVSPSATTTYTATATGTGGSTTATAKLTVTPYPAPTVSIAANPNSVFAGSSSTLTVSATNATSVTVNGTDGSSYTFSAAGGSQPVSPSATTTYTATATGNGGSTTATAKLTVNPIPAPTVGIAANPTSFIVGGSSTLTVIATNATSVTVTGTDGSSYTLPVSGGTQSVSPAATTTYTATANGTGGTITATATVTVNPIPAATVTITANPTSIFAGSSSTLTVTATYATAVTVTGTDGSSYTLTTTGGTQAVSPTVTTTYTAAATGTNGNGSATTTVTVKPAVTVQQAVSHVVFMLQENHTFDNYFGMLNPYREANSTGSQAWNIGDDGNTYNVDGIDDKLTTISNEDDEGASFSIFKFTSTCIDDESSAWLASYGDANRYNFAETRSINMDGFVHNAEGYAKSCAASKSCSGTFTDLTGQRSMGYYDQGFLNYYYYMASQFALSDRWFSPVASKSIDNRIATFTGGTTQGLVQDPGGDDHLSTQLNIPTIFQELDAANVSWKIYYTVTEGFCTNAEVSDGDCPANAAAQYPATDFSNLSYSYQYLYTNPTPTTTPCAAPTQSSSLPPVNDPTNSFCIDLTHVAPLSQYYIDLTNGTLPSFAFIEAGYGNNDEHPGSGQEILMGQAEVANVVSAFMASPEWSNSVFFLSYDEGGGPYDHVPPVPGSSNSNTILANMGTLPAGGIPDIGGSDGLPGGGIAVNPDATVQDPTLYFPCLPAGDTATTTVPATLNCDLEWGWPGATSTDAAAENGFAAQLGFRVPNIVISPFTRRHYVSHIPMDHTAVIRFVEDLFINKSTSTPKYLTNRDAAQPNLLDFFDFNNVPWATPPTPPTPVSDQLLGQNTCTPTNFAP